MYKVSSVIRYQDTQTDIVSYIFQGQLRVNNICNITLADSPASNGLIHDVDCVNVPVGYSTLPNFCNNYYYGEVPVSSGYEFILKTMAHL